MRNLIALAVLCAALPFVAAAQQPAPKGDAPPQSAPVEQAEAAPADAPPLGPTPLMKVGIIQNALFPNNEKPPLTIAAWMDFASMRSGS